MPPTPVSHADSTAHSTALRESEERLRAVFGSSPDFLMLLDCEHCIRMINRVEEGLSREDVLGTHLYELVAPADGPRVKAHLDRVVEQGQIAGSSAEATDHLRNPLPAAPLAGLSQLLTYFTPTNE